MPAPFDDTTTFLTTTSNAVRQVYHDKFEQMHSRFGARLNRNFKPSKRVIEGDGVNIQLQQKNMYGARFTDNLNADFGNAYSMGVDTYKVTLSETPSSNDFRRLSLPLQITHLDLTRAYSKQIAPTDFVKRLISESMQNIAETTALHRHLDTTALVALVNGTPAKNDNRLFASCSAISTTGGARFPIDTGSIAAFPMGLNLDVYASGGAYRFTVQVTNYNPRDSSVGVYGLDASGNPSSSVNINSMADNDELYISGEKNKGLISIGEWFRTPSTGDSFFDKDRTDQLNNWLLPHVSGPTSATLFSKGHIDNCMNEMGYIVEDDLGGYTVITTLELETRYRQEIGNDVFIQYPTREQQGELVASYGFDSGLYRHPTAGRIVLLADQFAPPRKIRGLKIGDWETQYAGSSTWEWLSGDGAGGNWSRMQSNTPGGGKTTVYRMEGMLAMCDICTAPRRQFEIANLLAS